MSYFNLISSTCFKFVCTYNYLRNLSAYHASIHLIFFPYKTKEKVKNKNFSISFSKYIHPTYVTMNALFYLLLGVGTKTLLVFYIKIN